MLDKKIDLHIHSRYSDGLLWPDEIIKYAVMRNIAAISIADHDTVAGIESAVQEGEIAGVEVVPGIEISVFMNNRELHFLGYFFDYKHPEIRSYNRALEISREKRAQEIIRLLNKLGFRLRIQDVIKISGNAPIGRPHIAEALVAHNYVFSLRDAFNKYLGEGKPAYVPKSIVKPADAIQLIKKTDGLVFLAHPAAGYVNDREIQELVDNGLDGLETIHPKHTNRDVRSLQQIAKKYNLLQSGGSDCHGGREGGVIIGSQDVPYSFLKDMKKSTKYSEPESF